MICVSSVVQTAFLHWNYRNYPKSAIAADKAHFLTKKFIFLHEKICCGYSWEVPPWATSHEYPQHTAV